MPSVSVIIPSYNSARTIVEALESVAAQARTDAEVRVVDDASADDTVSVTREWMARQPMPGDRWSVICLARNSGPAGARNRGVAESTGAWIAFLDADDVWLPARLEQQLACLDQCPDAVMLCGGRREFGSERVDPRPACDRIEFREVTLDELARHNPIVTSTVLARRTAFEAVGGFDERFRGPEDYDLWIRLASQGRILELAEPLACYRHRPGSLSLDERRFLPQVLRVLDKAFGPGGALQQKPEWKHAALATQYQQASWMAFSRGARAKAVGHLAVAWAHNIRGPRRIVKPWLALLYRYLVGRPVNG